MISLAEDCLIFQTANGEGVPFSAEMISVELIGDTASVLDPDFVRHAAAAVFHYFRIELGKESVTVAEFTEALEKVLRGFNLPEVTSATSETAPAPVPRIVESDLCRLAAETGKDCELFFFPRLRDELRLQLRDAPQMLCFQGLRRCVKILVGARRWTPRCQHLQDQIVEYLRNCITQDNSGANCALVVK